MMRSSYNPEDVTLLLKDITGMVQPLPACEREVLIQSGTHYCEMLPLEYKPTQRYMDAYENALQNFADTTANAVSVLAEKLYRQKGKNLVIVSLARAGIPAAILVKRYIKEKYGLDIPHYAISIIRGRGIDNNAMQYILERHAPDSVQFVDGWIGKGAIYHQLRDALAAYPGVSSNLAVLSDPSNMTELCGTHEDILIPSSCLNATVTGLISRTFLRKDCIKADDFHGAAFYEELKDEDLSEQYLMEIQSHFDFEASEKEQNTESMSGQEVVESIAECYGIKDINFIKPGIGEATRVLLRRIPWKILVRKDCLESEELNHIKQLAVEKGVPVEVSKVNLGNYKVCGIIRSMADI